MTVNRLSLLAITLCVAISGCSSAITATRDTPIQDDRGTRTFGSTIDDSLIETKVKVNVAKAATDLGNGASRIVVTSFNGVVLLAGQTPRADLKAQAEQAAAGVQRVKKVHNELQVMDPITLLAISNDALLTTKYYRTRNKYRNMVADFVVLDLNATALQQLRQSRAKNIEDAFFALTMLGDDRNIAVTYVYGEAVYVKARCTRSDD